MTPRQFLFLALIASLTVAAGVASAEPTDITVRVISKGAKFIGTSMGGVRVTFADAQTGELLAEGVTRGETGDTDLIMLKPRTPETSIATEDAAKFTATLDIEAPRLIEVTVYGPLTQRQAAHTVSATQWVVPGRHVAKGDGWVLEMPGLVVDVLAPPTHIKLAGVPQTIELEANVTMMCGCPIEPGGIWNADEFDVLALLKKDGESLDEVPLEYAGSTSQFRATVRMQESGTYEATVYAFQRSTGNTGLDGVTFVITE